MPLSPLAHYCIRKLLRQSAEDLSQLFVHNPNAAGLSEMSLDKLLSHWSCQLKSDSAESVELELLIKLYQQFEKSSAHSENLIEIKRRILQIFGFQISPILPIKFPTMVELSSTQPFAFFYKGRIQRGIRYQNALFGAVKTFPLAYRLQAYQTAWALSAAKVPIVLTFSRSELVIWINLQSPTYAVLVHQNLAVFSIVLTLNSALHKRKFLREQPFSKPQSILSKPGGRNLSHPEGKRLQQSAIPNEHQNHCPRP
ncbi:hypothetical protein Q2T42_02345 [Leptolyngbya boryana CZ1]|uniref:Uncharacterized protein n=1 Tax=Leptolyngbya boryana CZ1 TaxID=3060204 RepID=A0AA96WW51_LEPBY|nr:hypothetical protein [Leptolyngbya boryana]WNZ46677.1 hypothetical protein Q2T42_02345 [Leptolyngbya boryana CZ1]